MSACFTPETAASEEPVMPEPNKIVPIKSERTRKALRSAQRMPTTAAVRAAEPVAAVPAVSDHGAELVRSKARLAQIIADRALLEAEIEALVARHRSLGLVEQSIRAAIAVLDEAPAEDVP
jgi:hypothetical protein